MLDLLLNVCFENEETVDSERDSPQFLFIEKGGRNGREEKRFFFFFLENFENFFVGCRW